MECDAYGLEPGTITPRPSAAEAEIRAEVERWKFMHDDLFNVGMKIKSERDQLRAELERVRAALVYIRDQCHWEKYQGEGGGGDDEIGIIIDKALASPSPGQQP
jgi:hypothetical protein